jgi:hypothetical protein
MSASDPRTAVCHGTRRVPIENIKPAPPEWKGAYARRYGIAHCMVCKRWFVAHKDGTPVYHVAKP